MTTRTEYATAIEHEIGIAIRALAPQRSAKVLAAAHVEALRTHQMELIKARAAISKALLNGTLLLEAAGADGAGIRTTQRPTTGADVLHRQLLEVRARRGH